jgi:hypothetical protein
MSDEDPSPDGGDEWSYGDDKEGDRTQYGILIDSEAADFFRDMVKLANDGKIREKTGPEMQTAMKYYTAVFFAKRPYDLERVADGQVDYIRNPEEFVEIAEQWSEDVGAELAQVGNAAAQTRSERQSTDSATLLDDGADDQAEEVDSQRLTDPDEIDQLDKVHEAVRILEEFLDRSGDDIPEELLVESNVDDDSTQQEHDHSERESSDVLETDT